MKTKQYIIPLPDAGVYPPATRKRDTTLFGVDIEDAMLCVLQGLTDRVVETNPEVFMQDLLEQAFDHFNGLVDLAPRKPLLQNVLDVEQSKMVAEVTHLKDDIGYVKQNLAKLLILAEMFLAPYLKQVRDKGKIVTVEAFKRYPTLGTFNATVLDDEPSQFKGWENDYLSLVKGAYGDFLTELRHDNLRKLTVNTRDSSVSFKLPKPAQLPTDLNTIDTPGYFSGTPVTNAGTPLAPIPEAKLDEILDIIGEGEVSSETFDYSLDGFLAEVKSVLLFNRNDKEIEHIILVIRLLVGYYSKPPTDMQYHTLMNFLGVTDFVSLKDNLNNAYRWYSNVASTFADIEKNFPRTRVDDCIIHLEQMQCSLRALFLGLIWDLYGSTYKHSDPHEVFCKAVFDAEVDLNIEKHLGRLRVNFPSLTVFTPQELDNPEQIAGRMYFTTRYDDIGNFMLSDGYLRDQPLYLSLNDGSWGSPHLFGINAQKKTGVVFTLYNPLVLLGQPDILEYRMCDPEFRREVSDKNHDAIIHVSMKDPSSNQMVILKPSQDTVQVINAPQKLIDSYMQMRYNRFKHAVQYVQKSNLRINADMSTNF